MIEHVIVLSLCHEFLQLSALFCISGAIDDFSVAIEVEPRYADTYKRRGQARSALGEQEGALADLGKALELMPMLGQVRGRICHNRWLWLRSVNLWNFLLIE
jgi:tetratricopeptide (TPR) repeat protein